MTCKKERDKNNSKEYGTENDGQILRIAKKAKLELDLGGKFL